MKSFSQSGQDLFVNAIFDGKRDGLFLDIGCNHPIELSNTYALEQELGWRGLLIDRDEYCIQLCKEKRASKAWLGDALHGDWAFAGGTVLNLFGHDKPRECIDYLSLDCDENTAPILKQLLHDIYPRRFAVLTIETDHYRFGDGPRSEIRALLELHNYDILCRDVRASDGSAYEDWCVDRRLVDMERAERFRSEELKWSDILAKA